MPTNRHTAAHRRERAHPSYTHQSRAEWAQRARETALRGNALPQARLTPDAVRAIRANVQGWPRWRWAEHYGVHLRTVDKVATYETWRQVR